MDTSIQRVQTVAYGLVSYIGLLAFVVLRLMLVGIMMLAHMAIAMQRRQMAPPPLKHKDDIHGQMMQIMHKGLRQVLSLFWLMLFALWQAAEPLRRPFERFLEPVLGPATLAMRHPFRSFLSDVKQQARPSRLTFSLGIGALGLVGLLTIHAAISGTL